MVKGSIPIKLELIKVTKHQKEFLDKLKVHPRQPYYEILEILFIHCKEAIKKRDLKIFKNKKCKD